MKKRRRPSDKDKNNNRRRESVGMRGQSRHIEAGTIIDFRDVNLLRRFVTEHGKIMPARLTGASAKQQRQIARAVRRARVIGLMR